jgi:protein-S-isoprenylcysteine O-methyltransferase Ste14
MEYHTSLVASYLATATIIVWPVIPLFWIPVHLWSHLFRKIGLLTYILPVITWLPIAYLIFSYRFLLLRHYIEFPLIVNIIGVILLTIGTLIHIWTGKLLSIWGLMGLPEIYPRVEGKFIKEGAFSYVRHPTYLAHTLMFAGVFLITGVISVLVVSVADFLLMNLLVIPLEEKELLNRFGNAYQRYRERVPAFFPRRRKVSE